MANSMVPVKERLNSQIQRGQQLNQINAGDTDRALLIPNELWAKKIEIPVGN